MNAQDKQSFLDLVTAAYEIHGKPQPSKPVLRMWWKMLSQFPIEAVEYGIQSAMASSKYLITPAVVLEQLQGSDGRPDADEAWAIAKQAMDERLTVVWNDEIAEAYGIACEVYCDDKVGGRMAFRSAYERIVEQNRSGGIGIKWWPTLGDPSTRKAALEQAEAKGLLSHDQVAGYLPTPDKPMVDNVVAFLADESNKDSEKAKKYISKIRDILGGKATYLNQERWNDEPMQTDERGGIKKWYDTASGIEAKGAEIGLPYDGKEPFPVYKAKVFAKCGDQAIRNMQV